MTKPPMKTNVPLPGKPSRSSKSGRPIMAALDLMNRKWILRLIWELRLDARGFRELQAACNGLSPSVLSRRLKELQEAKIVEQNDMSLWLLSPIGKQLSPVLMDLSKWSEIWNKEYQ